MAPRLQPLPAQHDVGATVVGRLSTRRYLRTSIRAGDQLAVTTGGDSGDQAHRPIICLESENRRGYPQQSRFQCLRNRYSLSFLPILLSSLPFALPTVAGADQADARPGASPCRLHGINAPRRVYCDVS
jgi:hypothetical protein